MEPGSSSLQMTGDKIACPTQDLPCFAKNDVHRRFVMSEPLSLSSRPVADGASGDHGRAGCGSSGCIQPHAAQHRPHHLRPVPLPTASRAAGHNPDGTSRRTSTPWPARGAMFTSAICAQPVCAPARASILTGQYPSKHGVWKNAVAINPDAKTLASEMRQGGYTANHIGKWHLAGSEDGTAQVIGPVSPKYRGGFLDLWQSSNVLETSSHPYEGDLYDNDGKAMHFKDIYRTDFMTDLAQKFLRSSSAKSPFLLTLYATSKCIIRTISTPLCRQKNMRAATRISGCRLTYARCRVRGRTSWPITTRAWQRWTRPWGPFAKR